MKVVMKVLREGFVEDSPHQPKGLALLSDLSTSPPSGGRKKKKTLEKKKRKKKSDFLEVKCGAHAV